MAKSITVKRKKAGRPATGTEPLYGVRISDELMGQIQKWGRENSATRSEAIRRLVERGLKAQKSVRRRLWGHLKKTNCCDRWGRLARAPPRLQRCSSAKRRGCTSELTYSRSSWPVRGRGNDVSPWGYGPPQQAWRKPNEASAREDWKDRGSRKQKPKPEYCSRSIRRNEASCELASDIHRASTG